MRWVPVLLAAWIAFVAAAAGQRRTSPPRKDIPEYFKAIQEREDKGNRSRVVLRNGLTVVIEERALHPLAAAVIHVKSGSADEADETPALARLVARLSVRETATRSAGEVARQIRLLGGRLSFRADSHGTSYSAIGPAESLLRILEVQADMVRNPRIDAARLMKEMRDGLLELAQGDDRLWPPATEGTSAEITAEKIEAFRQRHYQPQHIILAVSGAVRREQILEKVVLLYGGMKTSAGKAGEAPASQEAPDRVFRYAQVRGRGEQPFVVLGYRVPGTSHRDHDALLLLSYILGRGRASLFGRTLLERGLALSVEVGLESSASAGTFLITARPRLDRIDAVEALILGQMEALGKHAVSEPDLIRAKAVFLKDFYQSAESLEQRAYWLAQREASEGNLEWEQFPRRLEQIGARQIEEAANRYFEYSNLSLVEYLPAKAEPRTFTAESFLSTMQVLVPDAVQKSLQETIAFQSAATRSTPVSIRFAPSYFRHELRKTSILRGPDIYLREEHAAPLVHLGFFFPGGRIQESSANAGLTELMLRAVMRRGDKDEGALLWHRLESLGAEIQAVNEVDFFGFQAVVLSTYLEEVVGTFVRWARKPALEEAGLELERQKLLDLVRLDPEDPQLKLIEAARRLVYGDHPYALNRGGTERSLSELTLDQVQAWAESQMGNVHPLIVIRGDIQGTAFLERFVSTLSDAQYQPRKAFRKEIPESHSEEQSAMPLPAWREAGRSLVMLHFPGPAKGSRDELVLQVVENILAGTGGRLLTSLREKQDLLREVRMLHEEGISGGAIFLLFSTTPEKEKSASDELLKEIAVLGQTYLRNQELLAVLAATIGNFYIEEQASERYVRELAHAIFAGERAEYEKNYLSTMKDISRDEIMSFVQRYFIGHR